MKKSLIFCLSFICLFMFFSIVAVAHSGGTDSNGGHYDSSTGEYHYHHGYSAHQHKNGVCPYDDNSKADAEEEEESLSISNKGTKTLSKTLSSEKILSAMLWLVFTWFLLYFFSIIIFNLFLKIPYVNKLNIIYHSSILFLIFIFLCITSNLSFKNIFLTVWDVFLYVLKVAPILLVAAIPTYFFCAEIKSVIKKILVYISMCILLTVFIILFNT